MKILAIDPASNKIETSTTGIVLLDNARLVDSWVVEYGMKGFAKWFHSIGETLDVLETIAYIQLCYPDAILQYNGGYKSDIPNDLLKILGLWKFEKSHHQDIRAAARLGLFYAMRNDVEEVIQDIGKVVSEYNDNVKKVAS